MPLALLILATDASSQTDRGTIQGLVTDSSGAVVTTDGFATAVTEGIDLRAGVQIRADVTLRPTGVQEQVTVSDHVHPNDAGNAAMTAAIDVSMFLR